jgi:hypothetical protein
LTWPVSVAVVDDVVPTGSVVAVGAAVYVNVMLGAVPGAARPVVPPGA